MSGTILNKKYVLIKEIGSGNFSSVWLCYNFADKIYYASKIFTHDNFSVGQNELKILKKIKSNKNVVNCVSYCESFYDNDLLCIIQELMVGSLYTIMKSQFCSGFPITFVNKVLLDMSYALKCIHDDLHIVHADIKPENILLVGHSIDVDNIIEQLSLNNTNETSKQNKRTSKQNKRTSETIKEYSKRVKSFFVDHNLDGKTDVAESEYGQTSDDIESDVSYTPDDNNSDDEINTDSDIQSSHSSHVRHKYLDSDVSDESMSKSSIDKHMDIVDKKYIINPCIVLGDFGGCIEINDLDDRGDIQTRHYRAPEIILRMKLTAKIDIWALGCSIFELLTGHVLFDPRKSSQVTCDLQQLYDIQSMFGLFPKKFYESRKNTTFFRNKYLLHSFNSIEFVNFDDYFDKCLDNKNYDSFFDNEIKKIKKTLHSMLIYDEHERISSQNLCSSMQ